jgi:O-antigen/teichoic acid export membrane protein
MAGVISVLRGAAASNLLFAIAKATEIVAIAVSLYFKAGPLTVAIIMLMGASLNVLMHLMLANRWAAWLTWRGSGLDWTFLKRNWKASFGHFCIFAGFNVINIQVPRLIVFYYLGPAALVAFTVFATYVRTARSFSSMMSQAAQIEVARAFAHADLDRAAVMIKTLFQTTVAFSLAALLAAVVLAPLVIPAWTHGHVAVAWDVLSALAIAALIGTYFDTALLSVSTLNRVLLVAAGYLGGSVLGIAFGILLLPWLGILAVAGIVVLLPELGGAIAATHTLRRLLHRRIGVLLLGPPFPFSGLFAKKPGA